jgi:Tfp pilus assembly protein PilV
MRDPYRPRRDWTRVGLVAVGVLALASAILIVVYLVRPTRTATEQRAEQALSRQMDRAEAANDAREAAARIREARAMQ